MAAKESQGLQIALIIFVILTVSLGVTTYLFFDKYQEQVIKFDGALVDLAAANEEKEKAVAELGTIKIEVVGAQQGEDYASLLKQIEKDREKFYQNKKPGPQGYRQMVTYLYGSALAANRKMIKAQDKANKQQIRVEGLAKIKQDDVDKLKLDYTTLEAVLTKQNKAFGDALVATGKSNTISLGKINTLTNELSEGVANFDKKKGELLAVNKKQEEQIDDLLGTVDALNPPPENLREAAGNVTSVNQGLKIVYINLGYADGLKKRTPFTVIPNNGQQITEAPKKGHIEVTRVIDAHRSEARITDSEIRNPILKNDRIFSNIWTPGKRDGFALAGFMDIDGDKRSDRAKVRSLILRTSGSIDWELNDKGETTGKLKPTTRYLIIGEYPNLASEEIQTAYNDFVKQAESRGVRTIPLQKILDDLGYKGRRKTDQSSSTFRKRSPTRKSAY